MRIVIRAAALLLSIAVLDDRLLVFRARVAESTRRIVRNRGTLARQLEECALWRQWQAARDHNTGKAPLSTKPGFTPRIILCSQLNTASRST